MESLKQKTISGLIWNFFEKLSVRLGQFVFSIILARLLTPDDFGLIAIIMFFLNISQVFIESGFSKALIQKLDRTQEDFSTVFVFNLVLSLFFYLFLFVLAPFISSFYNEPQLTSLIRVLSLILVVNALVIVQNVKLQIAVDFKKQANFNLISILSSGLVGIACAYFGFGVWSLVVQSLAFSIINLILYSVFVRWKISLHFSKTNFKQMWRYSSNLLFAGIVAVISSNICNLLIGKFYSVKSLGFYHRANSFTTIASDSVSQSIQQVTFPVLSQLQNDKDKILSSYKKMLKMSAFIIFPTMALLSSLAEPIVKVLLTDEWLPVIPLLQLMAFKRFLYPLEAVNVNMLNANGRSDLFLKMDLLTFPITILALLITLQFGVKAIVIGQVICAPIHYIINTYAPGKLFGYNVFKQLKDILPYFFATLVLYVLSYGCVQLFYSPYLKLVCGAGVGVLGYFIVCLLMKVAELKEIVFILKKKNL